MGVGELLPASEPKKFGANTASYVLTRGTHVLNFEFKLPADLPSSFELPTSCLAGGASARLYYGLRIEICNNSAQIRHTQQREIIVFRPLELTHFPRLRVVLSGYTDWLNHGGQRGQTVNSPIQAPCVELTEQKGLQEICPNTTICLNNVKENLRKEFKHGIFKGQLGNSCYQSFLGLPWDLQCHKDQRQFPLSLHLDKKNGSKTSCTSMTDTLAASLIRENSDGSTVDSVKQSVLTSGNELNHNVTAQEIACNNCETCMPKPHCTKWKSLVSVNEEANKYISGVKVIYRAKVNLLDNHHLSTVLRNSDSQSIASKETSSCSNFYPSDKQSKNEPADKHFLDVVPDSRSTCHKVTTQSMGVGELLPASEPKKFGANTASYVLTRGTHVLNFEFKLPADLPSSFELPTSCLAGGASARLYYGLRIEICNNSAQIRHTVGQPLLPEIG
ncbi:hypothetical protein AHF37_00343 [Paragonimus kellicotti]|nr:hypothetical protein AHF37_00343 [Paragonimus kellicotti]